MPHLRAAPPGREYTLSTTTNTTFRVLGTDDHGRLLMAVHRRGAPLNAATDFPAGCLLFLQQRRNPALSEWVQVHAFEYGRYATAQIFCDRQVQALRPRATHSGILTCSTCQDI
jgi:hypothetical protein